MSRNRKLALAAVLLVVVASSGTALVQWLRRPVIHDARPTPAFTLPPRDAAASYLTFIAVGDTGHPSRTQSRVASAMSVAAKREPTDMVLMLGDNFYDEGVTGLNDPMWRTTFEEPFSKPGLDVPFHVALGNHDYKGDIQAQIDYSAKSKKWRMPARYYSFTKTIAPGADVLFVAIDSNQIIGDKGAEQREWLKGVLADPAPRWKFVFGHHPSRSGGKYGDAQRLIDELEPLLLAGGVDAYFCGHEHYLALIHLPDPLIEVISGAGSEPRSATWNDRTDFAAAGGGFCQVRVSRDQMVIQFYNDDAELLYAHVVNKPAP